MHKVKYNSLELQFSLKVKSPMLIKSGGISANPSLPDMQFVRTYVNGLGETIYIPGSSLKGVFRTYTEQILKSFIYDKICDIVVKENSCTKKLEDKEKKNHTLSSYEIYNDSCRICKLFGNGKLKSRITFFDSYPNGDIKTEIRYGVAISRLTQSVAAGPFDMEVAVNGTFETNIRVENFECWQIGIISLALNGLNDGLITIGFGKNRGFGEVEVKVNKVLFSFANNTPKKEIWGIGKFISIDDVEKYGVSKNDLINLEIEPNKEFEEMFYIKREYTSENWQKISNSVLILLRDDLK